MYPENIVMLRSMENWLRISFFFAIVKISNKLHRDEYLKANTISEVMAGAEETWGIFSMGAKFTSGYSSIIQDYSTL